jgi:hypothetical protein
MSAKKIFNRQCNKLNSIIRSRNLFVIRGGQRRRVIDARIVDGVVVLKDLYSDENITVGPSLTMQDGRGEIVYPSMWS